MVAEGTYLTTVPSNDNAAVMEAKLTAVCDVIRELEAVNRTPVPKGRGRQANAAGAPHHHPVLRRSLASGGRHAH